MFFKSILKYIVNPKDAKNQVCNSTKEILKFAGIMKSLRENPDAMVDDSSDDSEPVVLTASAFQFLLWNRRVQIWHLVLQLLEYSWQVNNFKKVNHNSMILNLTSVFFTLKKNNQDLSESLILLFELSFSTFGKVTGIGHNS